MFTVGTKSMIWTEMLKQVQHDILVFFISLLDSLTSFVLNYFTWTLESLPAGRQARTLEPLFRMG